jgi:hypothetical protein
MTAHFGEWNDLKGACFREVIIGKSSTLAFTPFKKGLNVNITEDDTTVTRSGTPEFQEYRFLALNVFKRFTVTALIDIGRRVQAAIERGAVKAGGALSHDALSGVTYQVSSSRRSLIQSTMTVNAAVQFWSVQHTHACVPLVCRGIAIQLRSGCDKVWGPKTSMPCSRCVRTGRCRS